MYLTKVDISRKTGNGCRCYLGRHLGLELKVIKKYDDFESYLREAQPQTVTPADTGIDLDPSGLFAIFADTGDSIGVMGGISLLISLIKITYGIYKLPKALAEGRKKREKRRIRKQAAAEFKSLTKALRASGEARAFYVCPKLNELIETTVKELPDDKLMGTILIDPDAKKLLTAISHARVRP